MAFLFFFFSILQALRLTKSHAVDGLNGQVINLMSSDVIRFNNSMVFLHNLWKGPLEMVVFSYFLYQEIGYYGFIGIGFILCFVPIQSKCWQINFGMWCEFIDLSICFHFQYAWVKWRQHFVCLRPDEPIDVFALWMKSFKAYKLSRCTHGRRHSQKSWTESESESEQSQNNKITIIS